MLEITEISPVSSIKKSFKSIKVSPNDFDHLQEAMSYKKISDHDMDTVIDMHHKSCSDPNISLNFV